MLVEFGASPYAAYAPFESAVTESVGSMSAVTLATSSMSPATLARATMEAASL